MPMDHVSFPFFHCSRVLIYTYIIAIAFNLADGHLLVVESAEEWVVTGELKGRAARVGILGGMEYLIHFLLAS